VPAIHSPKVSAFLVGPVEGAMLERMFDSMSQAEVIARFDELAERHYPSKTAESAGLAD
jgi:hypothetical protein